VPPIYQPEVAARAIFWAAHHRKRELFVSDDRSYGRSADQKPEDFEEDPDLMNEAVQIELSSLPRAADEEGTAALILRMTACNLARSAVMLSHHEPEPSTEETIILAARCALAVVRKVATTAAR
jgi:hypothetical protein